MHQYQTNCKSFHSHGHRQVVAAMSDEKWDEWDDEEWDQESTHSSDSDGDSDSSWREDEEEDEDSAGSDED